MSGAHRSAGSPVPTLALDASTYRGTVAVFAGGELIASRDAEMRGRDEERLMPAVDDALRSAGLGPADLGAVICGAGPGSFTSLRIAASIAKGVAAGRGVALMAVPTLALMAPDDRPLPAGRYLATMDAMRGERYASILEIGDGGAVARVGPVELHGAGAIPARAAALGATPIGPDEKLRARPQAARALRVLAAQGPVASLVSLDAWEPEYGRVAEAQARWEAAHGRPLPRA